MIVGCRSAREKAAKVVGPRTVHAVVFSECEVRWIFSWGDCRFNLLVAAETLSSLQLFEGPFPFVHVITLDSAQLALRSSVE